MFCPAVVAQGTAHAALEKQTLAEINAAFRPGNNPAQPRYWDSEHSSTAPDDGDEPFFYLLQCQLVDLLHPNFIARCALCSLRPGPVSVSTVGSHVASTHTGT